MSQTGQVEIRPARLSDLDRLHHFETTYFGQDQFSRRQVSYLLTRANATTLVIESCGDVVGSATMVWRRNSRMGRLYSIVIDKAAQGKGFAARLLAECERLARERSCTSVRLEVRVDNRAAILLYQRHGYISKGVIEQYYTDGTDALRMSKSLLPEGRS